MDTQHIKRCNEIIKTRMALLLHRSISNSMHNVKQNKKVKCPSARYTKRATCTPRDTRRWDYHPSNLAESIPQPTNRPKQVRPAKRSAHIC